MWVTAKMLAKELCVSTRTIMDHVRKIESTGQQIRSKVGRPAQIDRTAFMKYCFGPYWVDKGENDGE